jgi:hypothetical protein
METKIKFLQGCLFAGGPFYFYPWKPVLNELHGDRYEVGYKHFRQGHRNAVNLSLHVVCLFAQVFGNFHLLYLLDKHFNLQFGSVRFLSALSAVTWAGYVLPTQSPLWGRVASAAALAIAYLGSPLITLAGFDKGVAAAFISVFLISSLAMKKRVVDAKGYLTAFTVVPLLYLGAQLIETQRGSLRQMREPLVAALLVFISGLSLIHNPLKPLVISATFLCRVVGVLADVDAVSFFGYAFLASLLQGITHLVSKEEATLIALERKGPAAKIAFEYAHVTFFPALLFHAIADAIGS